MIPTVLVQQGMAQQAAAAGMAGGAGEMTAAEAAGVAPGGMGGGRGRGAREAGLLAALKAIENLMTNRYKDHKAADDQNCKLYAYKDREKECPDGASHHIIPDHCWRTGSGFQKSLANAGKNLPTAMGMAMELSGVPEALGRTAAALDDLTNNKGYYYPAMNREEGYAICVTGEGKTGHHGVIHGLFDKAEKVLDEKGDPLFTAKLGDLEKAAAAAVAGATGCNKEKIQKQLENYHREKGLQEDTVLRADPYGKNTTSPTDPMADPIIRSRSGGVSK